MAHLAIFLSSSENTPCLLDGCPYTERVGKKQENGELDATEDYKKSREK